MGRNLVDFWGAPSLQQLQDADVDAGPYCDAARPSPAWINEVRQAGYLPCFIFEADPNWSQGGDATAGTCTAHEAHIKAQGHTGSVMVAVSDGSAYDPNYGWDNIFRAGRHWSDEATMPYFPYGNVYACEAFIAGADTGAGAHLRIRGNGGGVNAMIPETWGYGDIATQLVSPSTIPGTDLDIVHIPDISGGTHQPDPPPAAPNLLALEVPHMHRAILVNGLLDIFEVREDPKRPGRANLWWTHTDSEDVTHPAKLLTGNANVENMDIDIMPTGYGPIITIAGYAPAGDPPKYVQAKIVAYGYEASYLD